MDDTLLINFADITVSYIANYLNARADLKAWLVVATFDSHLIFNEDYKGFFPQNTVIAIWKLLRVVPTIKNVQPAGIFNLQNFFGSFLSVGISRLNEFSVCRSVRSAIIFSTEY